jgi:hypothetical protein
MAKKKKSKKKAKASAEFDPHSRTDRVFDGLLKDASGSDTILLLHALHYLCILTEENGFGMQMHHEELMRNLAGMSDTLNSLKYRD